MPLQISDFCLAKAALAENGWVVVGVGGDWGSFSRFGRCRLGLSPFQPENCRTWPNTCRKWPNVWIWLKIAKPQPFPANTQPPPSKTQPPQTNSVTFSTENCWSCRIMAELWRTTTKDAAKNQPKFSHFQPQWFFQLRMAEFCPFGWILPENGWIFAENSWRRLKFGWKLWQKGFKCGKRALNGWNSAKLTHPQPNAPIFSAGNGRIWPVLATNFQRYSQPFPAKTQPFFVRIGENGWILAENGWI